jgi:hypothetical protein
MTMFRVLRPDETIGEKISPQGDAAPGASLQDRIDEHVNNGSSSRYRSSLISCTAELHVALAFGGVLSNIAVIDQSKLPAGSIERLDKEYLRRWMTDEQAQARSRRSDEIVTSGGIHGGAWTNLQLQIKTCKRTLSPDEPGGATFPTGEELIANGLKVDERVGGANKRLFRVRVNGRPFCARPPRPNVDLHLPVLFGDDLVEMGKHEFASFCAYRRLVPHRVPRCALYTMEVQYQSVSKLLADGGSFRWAVILMEDIESLSVADEDEISEAAKELFAADLLLGNSACIAAKSLQVLADSSSAIYGTRASDGAIVRLGVDRALGCTYPEDLLKLDKFQPHDFGPDLSMLRSYLLEKTWLFGAMDAQCVTRRLMDLGLDDDDIFSSLMKCVQLTAWPPFLGNQPFSVADVLRERRRSLLETLPFYRHSGVSSALPKKRDGHSAVNFFNDMFVLGGNTCDGAVNDVWLLDIETGMWSMKAPMPVCGRYSFSAHAWTTEDGGKYIVVFGGTAAHRTFNDMLVYDVDKNHWTVYNERDVAIPKRSRHASTLTQNGNTCTMHIIGGHNGKKKLRDVWKVELCISAKSSSNSYIRCDRETDIRYPTHRGFAFQFSDNAFEDPRKFLIGGFGSRTLAQVQVVDDKTTIYADPGEQELSTSVAGFDAVVDIIGQQVILIGGCRQGKRCVPGGTDGFGSGVGSIAEPRSQELQSRVLYLRRYSHSEWKWHINCEHEVLDDDHRLPLKTSWSACLINHKVILFGGRLGESFSNEVIVVQLRPRYVSTSAELMAQAESIRAKLRDIRDEYGERAATSLAKDLITNIQNC